MSETEEAVQHPGPMTEAQLHFWEVWNGENNRKLRRDRIYDQDGRPRLNHYGTPRVDYITKIRNMGEGELSLECDQMLYMSAFCHNKPNADWHWMVDSCYDEMFRRTHTDAWYALVYKKFAEAHP